MKLDDEKTAIISGCGKYRYFLSRRVSRKNDRVLTFIMLNPSTADAKTDDPTIRKCKGFAALMDFGIVSVVNLFAFRATNPKELYDCPVDPVGPSNVEFIERAVQNSEMTLCAWGTHGGLNGQNDKIIKKLSGTTLHALEITKQGHPKHPLYISYEKQPIIYKLGL